METPTSVVPRPRHGWMILGLFLLAANLRAAITVVAPLLNDIADSFALRATALGALTATPILVFALASPLATRLARTHGLEKSFALAMSLLIAGLLLRSSGSLTALFGGMVLIAAGIAIGNVLLPSLVKRDFPLDKGSLTAGYAVFIGATAALGGVMAVPLAHGWTLGWQVALASPLVLALPAIVFWLPRTRQRHHQGSAGTARAPAFSRPLRQFWLAWQVTLFMGLNSFVFYLIIGWLPAILQHSGYSATQAGSLHGLMLLFGAFPALILIPLFRRLRDQRWLAVTTSAGMLLGCWGYWQYPEWSALWSAIFGLAAGSGFVVALSLITLRTRNPMQAAQLSGMAQCLGYLMAAAGLLLTGWMREVAGDWSGVMLLAVASCVLMAMLGYLAGRHLYLE